MLNPLPVKTSVGFRGVDWTVEEKKSQQGLERRRKEQKRRAQRKTHRKMSNEQLQTFLQFVVSPEETTKGNTISLMDECVLFLKKVEKAGIVAFPDGSLNVEKVRLSLEKFDDIKAKLGILFLIQSWMVTAVDEGLYSSQSEPSSPTSGGSGSTVSGLSNGTSETISLSSQNIADEFAAEIIKAALFAAYGAGRRRNLTHKKLCKVFCKIFRTEQAEYIDAMANARTKTDWPEPKGGGENDSLSSHSSKSCIDELASVASRVFAQKVADLRLNKEQVDALHEYCFVPLKRA